MKNRLVALSVAILGATVSLPSALAQRHGSAPARAGRATAAVSRSGGRRTGSLPLRRARRPVVGSALGSAFLPYGYSDYDDYDYEPEDYEPGMGAPPPVPEPMAQSVSPAPAPKPPEPLVIELRGDHWVRITPYGPPQNVGESNQPAPEQAVLPSTPRRLAQAAKPPAPLPPAVLVFRDGHQEEVGKYTIMGTTIYVSTDYWTSGSWTRQVQIAQLDVPATLKLNQERGANFRLPAGPEEVIVRP